MLNDMPIGMTIEHRLLSHVDVCSGQGRHAADDVDCLVGAAVEAEIFRSSSF